MLVTNIRAEKEIFISDGPSNSLNLNHRIGFRIWQYLCYSILSTKFSILSPLNVMNRFTLEQHGDLYEINIHNNGNQSEISRNVIQNLVANNPVYASLQLELMKLVSLFMLQEANNREQSVHTKMLKLWRKVSVRIHQNQLVIILKV